MEKLLKTYFGYDEFRPMQKEIVEGIINNQDTLVIMPTGGGKSLCYQLPALKFPGVTLVISPLISLMKDQVDSLNANGIGAEFINSSLGLSEINLVQHKILNGEVKLLYIAPERLFSESFQTFLCFIKISLIAIDEAHCISEWGHDFRPNYRDLSKVKTLFPGVPLVALTATATEKVREDIVKQLDLNNPKIFISSFDRDNLDLIVMKKKDSFEKILTLLKEHKDDSCIIYCFSRKDVESISDQLNSKGFNSLPYHAGLSSGIRKHHQELFIQDKTKIIVATIAFGMGIDKPDIRLVIHHSFSKSLEGYYQEIGRAGRDGLKSKCVLFYSYGDKRKHDFFLKDVQDLELKKISEKKLNDMISYCETKDCRRKYILNYFGENYDKFRCLKCDVCSPELLPKKKDGNLNEFRDKEIKGYDKRLFEKLRALRKDLAEQRRVPPYVIFSDVSLQEMSSLLPENYMEFLEIKGVGEKKLEDFGEMFLSVIKKYVKEKNFIQNTDRNIF
jgi:ATP-dependent DNA helicase RecQ